MSICKEILDEINKLRANPSSYVDKILKYKDYFEGNTLKIPGEKAGIETSEGASAYEEAANALKEAKYVQELIPSKGLFNIAEDYFNSIKEVGMEKIDSLDINTSIDKFGSFIGEFYQLMESGSSSPEQIIINFLVCDGEPQRSYRANLLNPNIKKIGIASGEIGSGEHCTIVVFSNEFQNKDNSDDTKILEGKSDGVVSSAPVSNLLTLSDMINPDSKKKEDEEAKKREEERLKKEAEEEEKRKKAEEEEKKRKEEEERLKKEEEERLKKEEEERLKKEEEERIKREEEERVKRELEEKLKKEKEEEERLKREEEERIKREEEERVKKQKEEEEKRRKEEEERKEAEERERKRREAEEEEKKQKLEKELQMKKEAEEFERKKNEEKTIKNEKPGENLSIKKNEIKGEKKEDELKKKKEADFLNTIILIYLILLLLLNF